MILALKLLFLLLKIRSHLLEDLHKLRYLNHKNTDPNLSYGLSLHKMQTKRENYHIRGDHQSEFSLLFLNTHYICNPCTWTINQFLLISLLILVCCGSACHGTFTSEMDSVNLVGFTAQCDIIIYCSARVNANLDCSRQRCLPRFTQGIPFCYWSSLPKCPNFNPNSYDII